MKKTLSEQQKTDIRMEREIQGMLSAEKFYKSQAWKETRFMMLQREKRCRLCGAGPQDDVLEVDHVTPRVSAPHLALSFKNLQVLCRTCNRGKAVKKTQVVVLKKRKA